MRYIIFQNIKSTLFKNLDLNKDLYSIMNCTYIPLIWNRSIMFHALKTIGMKENFCIKCTKTFVIDCAYLYSER